MISNTRPMMGLKERLCPDLRNPGNPKTIAPQQVMQIPHRSLEELPFQLRIFAEMTGNQ